ncbi:HEAT repeat domain-containing protein [Brevibacterium ammoniilyticum]
MLRHYESLGLVTPSARSSNGYREYSPADIGRIFHIEGLRSLGLSLPEIGRLLADPGFDASAVIADLITAVRERIAADERLLTHLEQVSGLGAADGESLLTAIDLMRSLESRDVIQRHKAALGSGVDGGVPVEMLSRAVLEESVLNAAGAMRWALAQAGHDAVAPLAAGLDSEDPGVRRNAIRALDEIWRTTSANDLAESDAVIAEAMRAALDDEDPEVSTIAALALGRRGDPSAVPMLLDIAMSGSKDIDAAEALAGFMFADTAGDPSVAPARSGPHADVPTAAFLLPAEPAAAGPVAADRTTADLTVAETIMAELRTRSGSQDPTVRFRVLQVLVEIPGAESDALIAVLAEDEVREIAATANASLLRRHVSPRHD